MGSFHQEDDWAETLFQKKSKKIEIRHFGSGIVY